MRKTPLNNGAASWLEALCRAEGAINDFKARLRDSDIYISTDDLDDAFTLVEWTMRHIDEDLQPDGAEVLNERCDQL